MKSTTLSNSKGQIWLNVASSTYVIQEFVNLDNHVFVRFRRILPILKPFLSKEHADLAERYLQASAQAVLARHDCRKPLSFADDSVDHVLCSHFLEHVHKCEAEVILADFHRVLRPGGTLHVIVPDLQRSIVKYMVGSQQGNPLAADEFIENTILSKRSRGSFRYRAMEFHGGFGLQHRWMYDRNSMEAQVRQAGFHVDNALDVPSRDFRHGDQSVHVRAIK